MGFGWIHFLATCLHLNPCNQNRHYGSWKQFIYKKKSWKVKASFSFGRFKHWILFMWRKWQTTCFFIALSKNGVAYYFFSFGSGVGSSVGGHLLSWHDSFVEGKKKKSWGPTPLCLMWTLWKERNKRAFNNVELFDQTIKYAFLYTFGI